MDKKIVGDNVIWGIIGAGDVCEKKSAPAMNKIPNSQIKAIMRRNPEKAESFAARHHIPFWYINANHIFNDPEINAVYIATPPESHAELTLKAAAAGKAVYVEKPMARNYQECQAMIFACQKAGVPLYVAYYRRALPKFLKLKELIETKAIGDVRLLQIEMIKTQEPDMIARLDTNWRVNPDISGGGYFHDVACHQLDLMDFLFGPIKEAKGFSRNQSGAYAADDLVNAAFSFNNNILGTGTWCFNADKSAEKEITILIGSKGKIEFTTFGDAPILVDSENGRTTYKFESPEHIEGPMIQLVVDDLLGKGVCPCDGAVGSRTSWVMDAICNRL